MASCDRNHYARRMKNNCIYFSKREFENEFKFTSAEGSSFAEFLLAKKREIDLSNSGYFVIMTKLCIVVKTRRV